MALEKGDLCRVLRIRHSAKRVLDFFKKISSLSNAFTGALGKDISKKNSLPSAVSEALGKVFSKKKILCRVLDLGHSAKYFKKIICRVPDLGHSAEKLKKKLLCRVPNSRHSAKKDVAEHRYLGQPMSSAALLPRAFFCRVPAF